jgi:hypothetical protein
MSSAKPEATLTETDVRAMVRLVGEVVASRHDHAGMKRMLMEGLGKPLAIPEPAARAGAC